MRRIVSRGSVLLALVISGVLALGGGQAFAYGYEYDYEVAANVSAEDAFSYVSTNFTSVFPAAMELTTCGDELYVGMECDLVGVDNKGHVRIEEVGSRHFVVRSLEGHAEGANKLINFTFETGSNGMLYLHVLADGKDNFWQKIPFSKRANRLLADEMWSSFASNVTIHVYQGDIPRMAPLI